MNQKHLNRYYKLSIFTTAATLFLIFLGGLVRVSGAGMGCPDWPKCYGLWIPPTDITSLPPSYDEASFNPILTWIEYINRLCGALYGILVLAFTIQTFRVFIKRYDFVLMALTVLLLTGVQGWVGKVIVDTELSPIVVTLHLIFALFIVLLLIALTQKTYYLINPNVEKKSVYPKKSIHALTGILIAALFQVVLGTQVREKLETIEHLYPLASEDKWISMLDEIGYAHGIFGTALALATWIAGYWLLKRSPSFFSEVLVYAMMSLVWLQFILGASLIAVSIPEIIQLFHQWTSAIYIAVCFSLMLALRRHKTVSTQ